MHRHVVALALAYALMVAAISGQPGYVLVLAATDLLSLGGMAVLVGTIALLLTLHRAWRAGTPTRPSMIIANFASRRWAADRGFSVFAPLVAAALTLAAYNVFKQLVLPAAGFHFGKLVSAGDRAMLGADAWTITHAMFPYTWQTKVLDVAYHAWFLPMAMGVVLCCFAHRHRALAQRYLSVYIVVWIVQGSVLAWFFPAGGPCFVDKLRGVDRFVPLMTRLHAQSRDLAESGWGGLTALDYQAGLLSHFNSPDVVIGGGISAMPSLHNALAVLFAAAGFGVDRRMGAALSAFALIIWVGSIHLGWHYALDGIVGAALTLVFWHAAALIQGRSHPRYGGALAVLPLGIEPVAS